MVFIMHNLNICVIWESHKFQEVYSILLENSCDFVGTAMHQAKTWTLGNSLEILRFFASFACY